MNSDTLAGVLHDLRARIAAYLQAEVSDYRALAQEDVDTFLAALKSDLERWIGALARGELTADEFQSLVRGQVALCKLEALKQAGLAKIRLDQIRNGIIDLILATAFQRVG